MFSPEQMMQLEINESNSTKSEPVPIGEYLAIVKDIKVRTWTKKDDPSQGGLALDIIWDIDDAGVKAKLDRDVVTCKQGIMLDLNAGGGIDTGKGKNIGLGRLREAVGLNEPGRSFSFSQLPGRPAKIKIKHRLDGENIYSEVEAVARI